MGDLTKEPQLLKGGIAVDDRGQLTFANDFAFDGVKRFYMAENFSEDTIRAFHGHKKEAKYVFVSSGSALVAAVEMDDTVKPNKKNEVHRFVLSARSPSILYVPAGYANGWKALEQGTKVMFFSTTTMEEAKDDDFRFSADYWGSDVWEVEDR
jgi:dTDP-4-dehydrorhamnose 3,5-epimerase